MHRIPRPAPCRILPSLLLLLALLTPRPAQADEQLPAPGGGELLVVDRDGKARGECPLEHTSVVADVAGLFSRVTVRQGFRNRGPDKIEAVYVFPLPENAAVDDMTLTVGDRTIRGTIRERQEARRVYDAARARGNVAALLDQERANIFTQSVANIEPGARITVEIRYANALRFDEGWYEFVFPMVVGPRYIPGNPVSQSVGNGWAQDTDRVPDASRITPPVAAKGCRAGHDIDLTLRLDAGRPLTGLTSTLHEIDDVRGGDGRATISLRRRNEIPNRDFILRYRTADASIGDALLTHTDARGGFFTLVLEPPARSTRVAAVPRELVFVLDTSGSMSGFPIEKAKDVMKRAIDAMRPDDTFNLITFSGDTHVLWPQPQPATSDNIRAAQAFLATRAGGGGTEMMKAIEAALAQTPPAAAAPAGDVDAPRPAPDPRRPMRICCFMTDGYVGNDMEIIDAVKRHAASTRVFSFGIGNSVNRYLLDGMARAGRGEVEYVSLQGDASEAVLRFSERIATPVLADIAIDWRGAEVSDLLPAVIPDLFACKPIMIHGRYTRGGDHTIRLSGRTAEGSFSRDIRVNLPATGVAHPALASLWARAKVEELSWRDLVGIQQGRPDADIRNGILNLGLQYALMTPFTSFVAVEELRVTAGGEARTVMVPVDMPEGVSHEGVFGEQGFGGGGGVWQRAAAPMTTTAIAKLGVNAPTGGRPAEAARSDVSRQGSKLDYRSHDEESDRRGVAAREKKEADKLADALRSIAKQFADGKEPADGRIEGLEVRDGRVEVLIRLSELSDAVIDALKKLGVEIVEQAKAASALVARVPLQQLDAVTKLDAVLAIEPLPGW